ncbi:MAG: tetratricopeptide repeat protein [Pirellulales bacterium]|nr:tetratricopeptide repeat protein [Pirellulales bacterium]
MPTPLDSVGKRRRNTRLAVLGGLLLLLWTSRFPFRAQCAALEDRPAPFVPRQPAGEEELDRREALASFAAARSLELQGSYAEALQKYQRAWRLDPQATEPLRAIVPLAMLLNRQEVAVRYALLAVGREATLHPNLLRDLAKQLIKQQRGKEGRKLFQPILKQCHGCETLEDIQLSLELGLLALAEEDYPEAAGHFTRVVHALEHPEQYSIEGTVQQTFGIDPSVAYQTFGESFLGAGRWDEAEAAFRRANQFQADPARWKYHLARLAARRGQPAQALSLLEEALAAGLTGFGMGPYEELARVLGATGNGGELIPRLEKLFGQDPDNVSLGYFLAAEHRRAGNLDRAEALYAALLEKTPSLIGYQNLAAVLREKKDTEGLLRLLGKVIDRSGFLETIGEEEQKLVRNDSLLQSLFETARKNYAAAQGKDAFGPCLAAALLALEDRQWETAEEFFEGAALADPPRAEQAYLDWGVGMLISGQPARAEKVLRRAIRRKYLPDDTALLYFYLAGALSMQDRIDEALDAAQQALALKTRQSNWWGKGMQWLRDRFSGPPADSVRFFSRVGWVLARGKRYNEALRTYRNVIEKFDPDYRSDRLREELKGVRLEAANVAALAGRSAEAEEWLEQVLDEFPGDPGASNDLGYLWAEQGRHLHRALRMTRAAAAAEPENAAFRDSLGWVLYLRGNTAEAIAELEKAAAGQPDGEILDHLGDAYSRAGRLDDARRAWQKAVKAYRQDQETEKAEATAKKLLKEQGAFENTADKKPSG